MGALAHARPTRSGRIYTCKIGLIYEAADKADRAAITEDLANPNLSNRAIGRWLGISENTVVKHRAQNCACFRG